MRKIFTTLKHYYQEHFHWGAFIGVSLFVAVIILANEQFHFYDTWIQNQTSIPKKLGSYLVLYILTYGGALLIEASFTKKIKPLAQIKFWLVLLGALFVYTWRGLEEPYALITEDTEWSLRTVYFKLWYNGAGLFYIVCGIIIYWWWSKDYKHQPLYGLTSKGVTLWPYFVLVLIMLPFIYWASRDPSFHTTYPRYQFLYLSPQTPHYNLFVWLYEFFYSIDFAVTEFFFRGFLILALGRFIGPQTILPMCAFYVTIHFGKPLGEVISSFFGGLLLGVLTWQTKSIYGGIIVHLGIALAMEFMGLF